MIFKIELCVSNLGDIYLSCCKNTWQGNIQYIFLSSFNNFKTDLQKKNWVIAKTWSAAFSSPAHRQHSQRTQLLERKSQDSCYRDGLLLASAPRAAANRENGSCCFSLPIRKSWSPWDFLKPPSFYSSLAHRRRFEDTKIWLSQDFWFSNKKKELTKEGIKFADFLSEYIYLHRLTLWPKPDF